MPNAMKRIIPIVVSFLSVLSCSQATSIPYEEVKNYFFRNDASIPENPKIDSAEQFGALFGAAAFMGKRREPTPVDFDKEFVIAVVNPITDCLTELAPESLTREGGELVFAYRETVGEKQTWSMQPVLLVKVDRKYETESVRLSKN